MTAALCREMMVVCRDSRNWTLAVVKSAYLTKQYHFKRPREVTEC